MKVSNFDEYVAGTYPGETDSQAAVRVGVSRRQIHRYRSRLIEAGEIERLRPRAERVSEDVLAHAEALLRDRSGYLEAAKTVGVDEKTLRRHFPDMGLTPQEISDRMMLGRAFNQLPRDLTGRKK